MFTVNIDPILFHLGPLAVSWYGIAVAVAIATGFWLITRETRRRGLPVDEIGGVVPWALIGGLVGARLLHVVDRWDYYAAHPLQVFAIQNGGLAILGAILGGALASGIYLLRRGLPVRRLFDAAAPGIVLGQAIGRLGCLVTGDALGPATNGSWGVVYLNPHAQAPQLGVAYQPVFLYEMAWDLTVFGVLWLLRKRLPAEGQLFAVYLALYAVGKFGLTFLRSEVIWFGGLQEAQWLAIGALLVALAWANWGRRGALWARLPAQPS